jgi:serine/threonine protein kinase
VSDDEDHHHHHHGGSTAVIKPAAAAGLPGSSPAPENNEGDSDNNKNDNGMRSPSFHDDSAGHFRGVRGTLIADRYRIIRDVGFGTFGRVVECLDLESRRRSHQHDDDQRRHRRSSSAAAAAEHYVAIKIVRKVKRYNESAQIEARIVQDHVNRRGGRGVTHCAILHDAFTFAGHFCMVFENLGLSLYDFMKRNKYQPFSMACIQDFTVQLLQTLEFLHSFRLIHTDLKVGTNIYVASVCVFSLLLLEHCKALVPSTATRTSHILLFQLPYLLLD